MKTRHIWFLVVLCVACSTASYKKILPDGTILEVSASEFGTDKALQGFTYRSGEVEVSLDSLDKTQTKGLEELNGLVRAITQGAIAGMK